MAALKTLEARLEKLEQAYSPAEVKVIFVTYYTGGGEVIACRASADNGFRVLREPGESVDRFQERAADLAREYYQPVGPSCLVLYLERSPAAPRVEPKPAPVPSPIPDRGLTVRPKAEAPTVRPMTIREQESSAPDRRWDA